MSEKVSFGFLVVVCAFAIFGCDSNREMPQPPAPPTPQIPQIPQGNKVLLPTGHLPTGQLPQGQIPQGQIPQGQIPQGKLPTGQFPTGQFPTGQMPTGQLPTGQLPTGKLPTGQVPQNPYNSPPQNASKQPPWLSFVPPQQPGWDNTEAEDHGPSNGYILAYQHTAGLTITLFIYNRGQANIPTALPAMQQELTLATAEIFRAQQMGRYQNVRPLQTDVVRLGSTPTAPQAARQQYMITDGGREFLSLTYVTVYQGFYHKFRISLRTQPTPQIMQIIDTFLARHGALLV